MPGHPRVSGRGARAGEPRRRKTARNPAPPIKKTFCSWGLRAMGAPLFALEPGPVAQPPLPHERPRGHQNRSSWSSIPHISTSSYVINPWMKPGRLGQPIPPGYAGRRAPRPAMTACAGALTHRRRARGNPYPAWGRPSPGHGPFPANARGDPGRPRHYRPASPAPNARGEEEPYRAGPCHLCPTAASWDEVSIFPEGLLPGKGAGRTPIWGYGAARCFWGRLWPAFPSFAADHAISPRFFDKKVGGPCNSPPPQFYHLDYLLLPAQRAARCCFYPPAFTPESLALIHETRPRPEQRPGSPAPRDAARLLRERGPISAALWSWAPRARDHVRGMLAERGYKVADVDLDPFILSGGGRLLHGRCVWDRRSK